MDQTQLQSIANILLSHRFHFTSEAELQDGIEKALQEAGLTPQPEVVLTIGERIDFLVGDVGIEVKVKGSQSALLRQTLRYAKCPEIQGLLIATTLARHRGIPKTLNEKPVLLVYLGASSF
jgi:hypothetical protein